MPKLEIELTNSGAFAPLAGGPAFELQVSFPPRRTRFLNATVLEPEGLGKIVMRAPASVLVWLAWDQPLAPNARIRVELEYFGEPTQHSEARFDGQWGQELGSLKALPAAVVIERTDQARKEFLESSFRTIDDVARKRLDAFAAARDKEIEDTQDPTLKDQSAFFKAFDVATSLDFVLDDRLRGCIECALPVLTRRVVGRALAPDREPNESLSPSVLRTLSDLQLSIFRAHFHNPINVAAFADAFVAFSTGQLAPRGEGKWNAQPDSAFFFFFAEFAIHAIERAESAETWKALLPTFVMCQELYSEVYAPYCTDPPPPPTVVDRELRTFLMYKQDPLEQPKLAYLIQRVRARYAKIEHTAALIRRHAINAQSAFPLGLTGVDRPCLAIRENSDHSRTGGAKVSDKPLGEILLKVAKYVDSYLTGTSAGIDDKKFVLVEPETLPNPPAGSHFVFATRQEAIDHATAADHVLGPLTVIYSVGTGDGWFPGTLAEEIHITNKNLTMLVRKPDGQFDPHDYPHADYDTFIVVVPRFTT